MTYEKLALLRTLAVRPSRLIAPGVQHMVDELVEAGYVSNDNVSGWIATAEGCHLIEIARVDRELAEGVGFE